MLSRKHSSTNRLYAFKSSQSKRFYSFRHTFFSSSGKCSSPLKVNNYVNVPGSFMLLSAYCAGDFKIRVILSSQ